MKAEDAEQALHLLEKSHDDALATIEKLTADLKAERLKNVQLQHELKQYGNRKKSEADVRFFFIFTADYGYNMLIILFCTTFLQLQLIIEDLRSEIQMLQDEQARLISSRFGALKDEQYQKEMRKLQEKIEKLEKEVAGHIKDKADLNAQLQKLAGIIFFDRASNHVKKNSRPFYLYIQTN
jgi:hypothetical protein